MIEVVLVAAYARNRVIGFQGGMPWPRMAADMRRFRQMTLQGAVLMGRRTFESLGSSPLTQRYNLVVSRAWSPADRHQAESSGVRAHDSIDSALRVVEGLGFERLFVIGGGEIYRAALPLAHRLELTEIDATFEGDAFFPELPDGWLERSSVRHSADRENPYDYTFKTYTKLNA